MGVDYYKYIASDAWARKRKRRLEIDNYECQTCLSSTNLEVHHKTYERLGHERMNDLITLCNECHDAITSVIRHRRYSKRDIPISDSARHIPTITERIKQNVSQVFNLQDSRRVTPTYAQRATSRSDE